ncbi:MAG: hypothetical protein GX134_01505 [candidate division WS1 bacterium]|nr:hypothetical protein [candidate division WS1 bacterium]
MLHHLLDTANVAGRLWEHRMPPTVRQRLAAAMGLDPDGARSLASLIAGLHDLGKATPPPCTEDRPRWCSPRPWGWTAALEGRAAFVPGG